MAFPSNVLSLAHAIGSQFTRLAFGGSVPMSTGLNQIIDDVAAAQTKVGTSEASAQDSPLANTGLFSSTNGKSKWRQIAAADISSSAAIAATQLAAGASNSVLAGGGSNAFTTTPTVVSLTTTAALQGGTTIKAGARIYPGALNGPSTGVQPNASLQMPYLNGALAANTATTIASFPMGRFLIFDLTTAVDGHFSSNSISTLTDRGSDATIQIGGADPGASTSKIWVSLSSGTLQIYNRYAAAHFIVVVGWGMN